MSTAPPRPARPPHPACPPLEDNLCFAVYSAGHAFTAAYKPLLRPLGLTYPQYLVLLLLWEADGGDAMPPGAPPGAPPGTPLGVKDLGARLHLDSGTLTPLLKRMEAAGLLARERDGRDERQVRIRLTARGRALRLRAAGVQPALSCLLGEEAEAQAALRARLSGLAHRLRAA